MKTSMIKEIMISYKDLEEKKACSDVKILFMRKYGNESVSKNRIIKDMEKYFLISIPFKNSTNTVRITFDKLYYKWRYWLNDHFPDI